MSNRNREAGHSFERDCVKRFVAVGFPNVKTSRAVNRSRDAQKIDLANEDESVQGRLPFNVQCKNTSSTLAYEAILASMPKTKEINVILHKRTKRAGTKFMVSGQYAFMHLEDFFKLVEEVETLKKLLCK